MGKPEIAKLLTEYMDKLNKIELLMDYATKLKAAGLDVDDAITMLIDRILSLTTAAKMCADELCKTESEDKP